MRSYYYHNSAEVFDRPSYTELTKRARGKKYANRALGLFASTERVGLEHYGDQQYQFQLALNSVVIEADFKVLERAASWSYFEGLRRGWITAGVDAVKCRADKSSAHWLLIVLNFDAIEHWDRMRWENAFFQGMRQGEREDLLAGALDGDLGALLAAFCCRLAPMGSVFWMDQYERLEAGKDLSPAAVAALGHALQVSKAQNT